VTRTFSLGGAEIDFLKIDILARSYPSETDYWDGNWVRAHVHIAVSPWRGAYRADLRCEDFARFRQKLQRVYDDVNAPVAEFDSMEPWLQFEVQRSDRIGHIAVRGKAQQEPFFNGYNVLQFALDLDQSYLPSALADLVAIEADFPVRGSP
jgi:hypothetical protein